MSKELLGLLIKHELLQKEQQELLLPILPSQNTSETIPLIKKELLKAGIQFADILGLIKEMAKKQEIRNQLFPYLDQELLLLKLCQMFEMNPEDQEHYEFVKTNIDKKVPLPDLIKNIYLGYNEENIPQQSLNDVLSELKEQQKIYDEMIRPPTLNIFDGENIEDIKTYQSELQQDIKQIPQSMDQYIIKKIELDACRYLIESKEQPTQIRQSSRKYIQKLELKHEESIRARDMIFSGKDIRRNLKILRYYVCGIDIQDVFRMIRIGRQIELNAQDKNTIVVLFMGLSKAGKTTLVTRLMGYQMVQKKINGIYTVQPKDEVNEKHKALKIGYSNRSTTRYPSIHLVPKRISGEEEVIKTMDSPGFQDTVSTEVEISNRITTIEALKKVQRLQIVIVINQKNWGVSGQDIEKLAKTVSSITRDYNRIKNAVSFVFNQFDSKFAESFASNVKDLYKNVKQKKGSVINDSFEAFFKQLEKQAKNKKNFIDPKTINQKQFFQKLLEKEYVQNPVSNLICDIGIRGKEQISRLCERYKELFYRYYQQKKIEQAQYCMKMISRMGLESSFQSNSDYELKSMKRSLKEGLEAKEKKLNIQFQQLTTRMITNSQQRQEKYKKLKSDFEELSIEVDKIKQIDDKFDLNISQIPNEVLEFYKIKMNDWRKPGVVYYQLNSITVAGLQFYKYFAPSKLNEIKGVLSEILEETKQSIIKQFKQLQQENKISESYTLLTNLSEVLQRNQENTISLLIKQDFQMKLEQIDVINLSDIKNKNNQWNTWMKDVVSEGQIPKIVDLLKFINVVNKYPKEMISGLKQRMTVVYHYIVDTLPKNIMTEYEVEIKITEEEEEQQKGTQTQDKNKQMKKKIEKLKLLTNWMKYLNKIQIIKSHHDNKLVKIQEQVIHMITRSMIKFQKIMDAFSKNNIDQVRLMMNRATAEFSQLESLIKVSDMPQLTESFEQLQKKLSECYTNYINKNSFDQNVNFGRIRELKKLLQAYKNTKNFKELLFLKNQNLHLMITKKLSLYQKKISDPIEAYKTEINEIKESRKPIRFLKLSNFISYMEQIRQYTSSGILPQNLGKDAEKKIKEDLQNIIFPEQILKPLDEFEQLIKQNSDLKEEMINKIQFYLREKDTTTKIKRSIQYLSQLISDPKLKQAFELQNYIERFECNQILYEQLLRNIKQKMNSAQQTTNVLDQLKKILERLKYLQTDQKIKQEFDKLIDEVFKKLITLNRGTEERKSQLLRNYNENKYFEKQFLEIYTQYIHDKTQTGQRSKQQLRQLFARFRNHTQEELMNMKNEVPEEQQQSKYLIDILAKLKKLHSFCQNVKIKFAEQFEEKDFIIQCLPKIKQFVNQFLDAYLQKIDNLTTSSTTQLDKVQRCLIKIQRQTNGLRDLGIKFESLEKKKQSVKAKSLVQLITNTKKQKQNKIKTLNNLKNIDDLKEINENFVNFYKSIEEKDRQSIMKSIQDTINKQILTLKADYSQNYESYNIKNSQLNNIINNLPKQLSQVLYKRKEQSLATKQKEQEEQIKHVFGEENDQLTLTPILNLAKKIQKINNPFKIQRLQKQFRLSYKFVKKENDFIKLSKVIKIIWENKTQIESLQILRGEVLEVQKNCLQNIAINEQKRWKKIFKKYQQVGKSDSDILSSSDGKKGSFEEIMNIYEFLTLGLQQENIQKQNSHIAHKIIKQITSNLQKFVQFTNECKKNITQITEGIIVNKITIQEIFEKYYLLEEDFKSISKIIQKQNLKKLFNSVKISPAIFDEFNSKIQSLSKKVQTILSNKFVYYTDQLKNLSDKDDEKRINEFEMKLSFLDNIMNGYNSLKLNNQIQMIKIKQQLKEDAKKATQNVLKQIDEIIQFDEQDIENDKINQMINYVIKLFKVLGLKPRNYMPKCGEFETQISEKLKVIHNNQKKNIQGTVAAIQKQDQNTKIGFRKLQDDLKKEEEEIPKIKDERQIEIEKIKKKYQQILKKLNGEDKQKKEKELESEIKNKRSLFDGKIADIEKIIKDRQDKYFQSQKVEQSQNEKKIFIDLLILKKLSTVSLISTEVNKSIDSTLKKLSKSGKFFDELFKKLNEMSSTLAGALVGDHQAFSKLRGKVFTSETSQSNDIQFLLEKLRKQGKIDFKLKETYKGYYIVFDQQQNKYVQKFKLVNDKQITNTLKAEIKQDGEIMRNKLKSNQKISGDEKVKLLGKIFALWSISIAEGDSDGESEAVICFKAHAAQILGILIIICVEEQKPQNGKVIHQNRLAEVKTGEGKSILLAGLSIYFALLGYDVDCACYSEILSKRDRDDFLQLFKMCGVDHKINYGIFQNVIRNLLNKKSDEGVEKLEDTIKEVLLLKSQSGVWNMLTNKFTNFFSSIGKKFSRFSSAQKNKQEQQQMNILIIDEIDVLFDRKYFGDTFNQIVTLQHQKITNLFKFIWQNKRNKQTNQKITYKTIQKSKQFENVLQQFSPLKEIIKNQIYGMLAALDTYQEQQYVIIDKKIMYKVEDTYKEVSYRYNTVYAYLKQHEKNQVSLSSFNQNMVITLCVSQFAYASLPEFYSHVVGVTGTLTCLPKYIKQYLNNKYKISENDMYPIPSVYSKKQENQASNRTIHDPIIVSEENHHSEIIKNLKPQFEKGRPILIFFRGKEELIQFYLSPSFQPYQNNASYLTEQHSQYERNERIRNSSRKSNITLFTNTYIRGIDFKLLNKKAKQIGGFHGIVTYLIQSIAEYIQATGRIGRQGNKGSFIEIFRISELALLKIDQNSQNPQSLLKKNRMLRQQQEKESCQQKLQISKKRHQQTMKVFNDPKLDQKILIEYVQKKNFFPEITNESKKARMVFLIDATLSMDILFAQLKIILPEIFADVYETLKKKKVNGSLDIQIAMYRNYNSNPSQLLQVSTFDNTGDSLREFIKNARVDGGWGNQAIEVGLQHANKLSDIGQVIIMGDARGNTKSQVQMKRQQTKNYEQERIKKGYSPTSSQEQLENLLKKKVNVSSFYLSPFKQVKEYFQKLSASSGGKAVYVDITKKQSSSIITQSVVEIGLRLLSDGKNVDQLLQAYKQILKRRMG